MTPATQSQRPQRILSFVLLGVLLTLSSVLLFVIPDDLAAARPVVGVMLVGIAGAAWVNLASMRAEAGKGGSPQRIARIVGVIVSALGGLAVLSLLTILWAMASVVGVVAYVLAGVVALLGVALLAASVWLAVRKPRPTPLPPPWDAAGR